MTLKRLKPINNSSRFAALPTFEEITTDEPHKPLLLPKKRISGRNCYGRITTRRRGQGHKKMLRIVDYKRDKIGVPAKVATIEYDPNRSARIALLHYLDGEKRYIIAPEGLKVGEMLNNGPEAEVKVGNAMPINKIPVGMNIHNIEMRKGNGGIIARSAGNYAVLMSCEGKKAQLKMPSGEIRLVNAENMATIGVVSNGDHNTTWLAKAGRNRWRGIRPSVRGVAMNPVDHPLGGGEGKSSGGRPGCSPTAMPSKGYKTRVKSKVNKDIVKRRR